MINIFLINHSISKWQFVSGLEREKKAWKCENTLPFWQTVVLWQDKHTPAPGGWGCGLTYTFTFFPVPVRHNRWVAHWPAGDPLWPLSPCGGARYLGVLVHGGATGRGAGVAGAVKVQVAGGGEWAVGTAVYIANTQPASAPQDAILDFLLKL